jgi:putative ABC transport system ATP-binding protein
LILAADNISRSFGNGSSSVSALEGVSLRVDEQEFLSIMGPSGSGKSTLMNILGLLDRPSGGSLRILDQEVTKRSDDALSLVRCRKIGIVFQSYNLLSRSTAFENVELPLLYAGVPKRQRAHRVASALAMVGLSHKAHRLPNQISGGEQQRVAIARALVTRPALLLADEPTGALDSRTGAEILQLFQELNAQGQTIVMITHDPSVAAQTARIVTMKDGALVHDGAFSEEIHRPIRAVS